MNRSTTRSGEGSISSARTVSKRMRGAFYILESGIDVGTELVAQFDHTSEEGSGHDVEREGVHMDVFRDGEKVDESTVADAGFDAHPGPVVADIAVEYALTYMERENERLIERYMTWRNE
ncbi:hypothetical protein [Halococcus sp. AFM35]|uniref:hypothetical protein n=1 Tax=Halococcus sp. AFM35 TaxID=3421653 RepID=UPI003EB9F88C